MCYLLIFLQVVILQYTAAQVFTLGGRNFLNNQNCANIPIARNFANNAGILANIGQTGYELASNIVSPCNNIVGQEYLLSNANYGNIGNANIGLASSNIGLAGNNIGVATSNIGLANSNVGLANIGSEVLYKNDVPMYANVVKPPREYGIEFSSGALQVGGTVEVNGRMPFSANVAVNGAVPSQGQGAVNYKCDQLNAEDS